MSSSATTTTTQRKAVRIALEKNEVRTFEMFDEDDVPGSDLWFTVDEITDIKDLNRRESREWRMKGYSSLLESTFTVTSTQQETINAFVQLEGHLLCRRGLERHCSRKLSDDRTKYKEKARDAVFMNQYRFQKEGMKANELAERLSCAYIDDCRTAKIFARRFGKADELAVYQTATSARHESQEAAVDTVVPQTKSMGDQRTSNPHKSSAGKWFSAPRRKITPLGRRRLKSSSKRTRSPVTAAEEFYAAVA